MTEIDRVALAKRAATAGSEVAMELFRTELTVETKANETDVVTRADREAQQRVVEVIREECPDDVVVGEEDDVEPRTTDSASGQESQPDERKRVPAEGDAWVIDPIDGTNNFVRGIRTWATSVAAVRDGETVAAVNVMPALDDVFVAGPDGVTRNGRPISVSDERNPKAMTVVPTIWWGFDRRDEYTAAARAIVERFGDMRRLGCAQAVLSLVAAGSFDGTITNVVVNPWDSIAGVYMVEQAGGTVTDIHGDPWRPGCEGLVASSGTAHEQVLAAAREIGSR